MKQHAQAILLFTGYPLEPIVALEIKKSFQSLPAANSNRTQTASFMQSQSTIYKAAEHNEAWFNNYE